MVEDWKKRGIVVCFANLRPEHNNVFFRSGLATVIGIDRILPTVTRAMEYIHPAESLDA
jgi:hypothetical protein